jgi:hypothetical protein
MKKKIIFVIFVFFAGAISIDELNMQAKCIHIHVNFGTLLDIPVEVKCEHILKKKISAYELLVKSGYTITGTREYGLKVVCRLNGVPNELIENCDSMPPEKAYWAVILKRYSILPLLSSEWGWAQKGIKELYLEPGDSLGLVFSENGEIEWPS